MREIDAVAFDLDGTLYPNYRFYMRVLPFVVKERRLMTAFKKARELLHTIQADDDLYGEDFYTAQAFLMAREENPAAGDTETARMRLRVERLIYRGWEPIFKKVKLFPHVKETLTALKNLDLKMGLLSDFPPEQKVEYLGLEGLFDVVVCSEETGRLKPDPTPFLVLAEKLAVSPDRILYVGNSRCFDAEGAVGAGMKAALKVSFLKDIVQKSRASAARASKNFHDYRYLYNYVLSLLKITENERDRWQ